MSVFYDHLLGLDELHQELLALDLPPSQHYHLLNLIDSTMHHEVLAVCLDCLPMEQHEAFLIRYNQEPNDETLLSHLKSLDPEIEGKISAKTSHVKDKLKKDIHQARS